MIDREQLINSAFRLAVWRAAQWARHRPHLADDLRSEALLALVLAAGRFDPDRPNSSWPGLVRLTVDRQLGAFLRGESQRARRFPKAKPVQSEDGEIDPVGELPATDPDPEALAAQQSIALRVKAAVGLVLGVTRERVRQIEARAFRTLREQLVSRREPA